jgi:hypothetical protein
MKRSPITPALAEARQAFDKASRALSEYAALEAAQAALKERQASYDEARLALPGYSSLQQAEAAHRKRQATIEEAQGFLRRLGPGLSGHDLTQLRKAATVHGFDELGRDKVEALLAPLRAIERRRLEEDARRDTAWRREEAGKADFTDEERRLILSTLHPDANASPARREAAFKAFNAKRGRRLPL